MPATFFTCGTVVNNDDFIHVSGRDAGRTQARLHGGMRKPARLRVPDAANPRKTILSGRCDDAPIHRQRRSRIAIST